MFDFNKWKPWELESGWASQRLRRFVLSLIWHGEKASPLCCLSVRASGIRKKQHRPELHPQRKTHQRQQGDLQHTLMSSHITEALSSCSVARLLSVTVWGMSHIHSVCEHTPQVREHTINSPTSLSSNDSVDFSQSTGAHWQDKGESSPQSWENIQAFVTPCLVAFGEKFSQKLF